MKINIFLPDYPYIYANYGLKQTSDSIRAKWGYLTFTKNLLPFCAMSPGFTAAA